MSPPKIDINCDLGEGSCAEDCARDALLMPYISRCNIACGGHAGDALTMQLSLDNARQHGLAVGAHPGYADRQHFGRRSLPVAVTALCASVLEQIQQLAALAKQRDIKLTHIKLHGALYNDAERDAQLADALCTVFARHYPELSLLGLPRGQMSHSAARHQLRFLSEGFIDRAYMRDGSLAPRQLEGAVHQHLAPCLEQALKLVHQQPIATLDHHWLTLQVDTLCLHGDNPLALALATQLSAQLSQQGYHWR